MRAALPLVVLTAALLLLDPRASPPVVASLEPAQQKTNPLLLPRALDLYAEGQFDPAITRIITTSGFTIEEATRWINAGGRATQERRKLIAATAALEYSAVRLFLIPRLVTWARTLVVSPSGPTEAEALWLRASVALSQGLGQWTFLTTGTVPAVAGPQNARSAVPVQSIGHVAYAAQRFPENPFFKLASVVAAEYSTSPARSGRSPRRFGGDASDPARSPTSNEAQVLTGAASLAESLVGNSAFRAEAHLRLGYIQFRLGQNDAALRNFDAVVGDGTRSDLRYLAHLYSGLALARVNRTAEAAAAFRAALRVVPGAGSATTLLTHVLLTSGQIGEAEALAGQFLSAPVNKNDPWDKYFSGDFLQYGEILGRLRERLR